MRKQQQDSGQQDKQTLQALVHSSSTLTISCCADGSQQLLTLDRLRRDSLDPSSPAEQLAAGVGEERQDSGQQDERPSNVQRRQQQQQQHAELRGQAGEGSGYAYEAPPVQQQGLAAGLEDCDRDAKPGLFTRAPALSCPLQHTAAMHCSLAA